MWNLLLVSRLLALTHGFLGLGSQVLRLDHEHRHDSKHNRPNRNKNQWRVNPLRRRQLIILQNSQDGQKDHRQELTKPPQKRSRRSRCDGVRDLNTILETGREDREARDAEDDRDGHEPPEKVSADREVEGDEHCAGDDDHDLGEAVEVLEPVEERGSDGCSE